MKLKIECCESYKKKKGKICDRCPDFAKLSKKERRKLLQRIRK